MLNHTRKGAHAEYLANYLLSVIGFTAQVPRQEDYGIDFFCSLNKNDKSRTTVGDAFAVQIKSAFTPLVYGKDSQNNWRKEHIEFLFGMKIPFFLGIIDLENDSLSLYNLSVFRFVKKQCPNCSLITFKMRKSEGITTINGIENTKPISGKIKGNKGDGLNYIIELQHPIIRITSNDLKNEATLVKYSSILQEHLNVEKKNIVIDYLDWPLFYWPHNFTTNSREIDFKWIHYDDEADLSNPQKLVDKNADFIVALALSYKLHGQVEEYEALRKIIQKISFHQIRPELFRKHPELYTLK